MITDGNAVAGRVQRIMRMLNLTQRQLAEQLGVTQPAVSKYLQGRIPPAEIVLQLAQLAGVDMEWILTGEEHKAAGRVAESRANYHLAGSISEQLYRLPPDIRQDLERLLDSMVKHCVSG
jgi:transcriptional regulator with XRE-family HTH domain